MVILFLTGSLEPGKDGVGDYTRRLAAECVRQNHSCFLLALSDPHLSKPIESIETEHGVSIPTLRLPSTMPWPQRVELARAFRAHRAIDWVSLQFVSYAYDPRGMARNLTPYLKSIIADSPLHIMFHELWIGTGERPPLKDRVVGQIQRFYLQELIKRLRPKKVTTSNPFYVSMLESIKQPATELALFGNIPTPQKNHDLCLPGVLLRTGICNNRGLHPSHWLGLFFGALYPEWNPEPFMSTWIAAAEKAGKRICLISVGRLGNTGEITWKKLQKTYSPAVEFITLGAQKSGYVSGLMQIADFGLAAAPWHLLKKSGSVAAMLDHGLPVIVTRFGFHPAGPSSTLDDPLLHPSDVTLGPKLLAGLPKRPARDRLSDTTHDFIRNLTSSS